MEVKIFLKDSNRLQQCSDYNTMKADWEQMYGPGSEFSTATGHIQDGKMWLSSILSEREAF